MYVLYFNDPNANGNFDDVKNSDWYFGAAGSAKNKKIISGYPDNTFRGTMTIPKEQIVSISARVLKNEMKYFEPENADTYLSAYTDGASIAAWAKADVALATQANMVLKRTDNQFVGSEQMTRGDAAIILKRLFDKIW